MSRLNGRVHNSGPQHSTSAQYQAVPIQYHQGAPVQYQGYQGHPEETEPSCLVRTPSGNVYIPSDMPKTSTLEYKSSLHSPGLHSPVKGDAQKVMEGYNVPFGGGLPAPVLPVRNNVRRPAPGSGPRGAGASSNSGGRGSGNPRCSWRCTAIIFITIAVVLAAILIYIAATTSAVAWLPHGGCAVLVDDPTVISEDTHLGPTASRGNPHPPFRRPLPATHHPSQTPQGHFQQFFLVYEPLQDAVRAPQGTGTPPRRMRRSVSHDLPSRMDTHSPDSPTPATDTLAPNPPDPNNPRPRTPSNLDATSLPQTPASHDSHPDTFDSPDPNSPTPDDTPHPPPHIAERVPTSLPHKSHSNSHITTAHNTYQGSHQDDPSMTLGNTVGRPERGSWYPTHINRIINHDARLINLHTLASKEGAALNNNAHNRAVGKNSARLLSPDENSAPTLVPPGDGAPADDHVKHTHAMPESADDVFAPVIDVVEYSNVVADRDSWEDDGVAGVQEYGAHGNSSPSSDSDLDDTEADAFQEFEDEDYTEDDQVEQQEDYEFGRSRDDVESDFVEYEQTNETLDNEAPSAASYSQPHEAAHPSVLLVTNLARNDTFENLPVPLENIDPNTTLDDEPVGIKDQMMGDAPASGRGRQVLRSWMGSFPTDLAYTDDVEAGGTEESSVPDAVSGLGHQGPRGASWFSRRSNSEATVSQNDTATWVPPRRRGAHSSVDTWFSRYGLETPDTEGAENKVGSSVRRMTDYDRTLFSSSEGTAGRLARSAARKRSGDPGYISPYDPNDPNGGPVPQSSPESYPSRILESMGVPHYQDSARTPRNADNSDAESSSYKEPAMAKDVFPHIFEYDLHNDHDDYYYDEPDYYYFEDYPTANVRVQKEIDDFEEDMTDEDEPDDVILDDDEGDNIGVVETGHWNPDSIVTFNSASQRLPVLLPTNAPISATQFPPDLRALSLTKEEFHVGVAEPLVSTFTRGEEVVEIEVVPLYTQVGSISSLETGPNYAPAVNREVSSAAETHHEDTIEAEVPIRTTTTLHPSPSIIPSHAHTSTPTPRHHTHRSSVPLHLAKFMPTRLPEQEVRSGHTTDGRKIPKFLKHISDQLSVSTDNTAASHGHRMRAHQQNERDFTPLNVEAPSPSRGNSQYYSQTSFDDDGEEEWTATGHSYSTSQAHSNTRTSHEPHTEGKDTRHQGSVSVNAGYRFNRSLQVPDTSALHIATNPRPRHSKRVTVNISIGTDDGAQDTGDATSKKRPLYLLSVSVPTAGWGDQKADITLLEPAGHQQLASVSLNLKSNQTHAEAHQHSNPRIDGGKCRCPCPCDSNNLKTPSNSIPIPPNFMPDTDHPEGTSQTYDLPSRGCALDPKPTTTPPPPPPPWVVQEMEEHQKRPQKTIPPDGTTFKMMELGQQLEETIPPYGYWNMQFYQSESAYVKFEVSIPRGSSIGVYGRRNALPTHTSYDFLQVLSGYKTGRVPRASKVIAPSQPQTLTKYLEQGHWFLSLYNDDGDPQEVSLSGAVSSEFTEGCPRGCSGNGDCILGSCQCHPGFAGPDCTQMMCPVLCSGHGEYSDGECVCRPGWKGRECSIRHDECEVPDCTGHGHCVDGRCRCAKGYKGEFCHEDDCPHPTCSDHGWCVSGTCVCQRGWRGADCAGRDDAALQCLPDCNNHGHFDLESHQCVCDPEWTGTECSTRVCDLDCGTHGRCEGGACLCFAGWSGDRCDLMTCDPRCEEHGQCKNGTCICMTGWNGRHCTLAGCLADCSGNGACIMESDEWKCHCQSEWEAHDCSVKLENNCDDDKDNDNDGLIDCADAECCSASACQHSVLCQTSVDPIEILFRKQPPAVTASFFQRMRFIVEEGSIQNYADASSFNASRASVVRGRVISGRGTGLRGVRVSHYRLSDSGFTLTRPGGWFDFMVNGGGAVRLLFGKSPFLPVTETVWVPWNEIVVTNTIVLTVAEVVPPPPPSPCPDHNYDVLKPVVLATWKHGFQGGCPERSAILTESQVVQESLSIPGTGLHLVYHSSRALGYESTLQLQLTPSSIPDTLRRIYLRITIEGILFEKTFEADPDIKFTYAWNRLNVYRQRVYGVTWAVVKVGFAYSNCDQVLWDAQTTQVSGHDMSISDIGGWDLSIHHRYNFHEGILQKGDGRNIHMKQKPRVMRNLMGDGHQREVACRPCDGPANKQRLLTPAALASGPDGSLYIADFNLIRRILPDNTVKTVVSLNETRVSYRYHLAVSPVTGDVFISDHEAHLILKVRDPDDFTRPEENFMPYVGSGERCLPGDEVGCGDNSLARDAKLQYPKGMAVSFNDVLFFADGTNVRAVDSDGIINTVIGTHRHRAHWQPLPCKGTVPVSEVSLRWPTALVVSPLDDSLYVLDDHHVLRLTQDGQVKVVAGRPLHCPPLGHDAPSDMAAHSTLRSPQSLAFAPNGDLYIAESDNERINRIRIIETDERIHDFAGADSKCNCQDESCLCYNESHVLATSAIFSTISAIAVTPDGTVQVLDQGNLRIRSVTSSIPEPNAQRIYEIFSPETQEVYLFNRFGHHVETRSIPTGRTKYNFAYNVNTSNGKLSTVTDAGGNRVSFLRDYTGQVTMIENSRQQKCRLQMSRARRLMEFVTPDEHNVTLTYHGATGLLRSRMDSTVRAYVYTYDTYGRLIRIVTPSGQVVDLSFDLSEKGARVTLTRDGTGAITMLIKGALVTETVGSASSVMAQLTDGSVVTRTAWGHHIATETVPYTLLQDHTLEHSFPVPGRQRTEIGDELVNSFNWKYFVERSSQNGPVTQVGRKMKVNGEDLLTFKYDLLTGTEAVLNEGGAALLNVSYDALGRPLRWTPVRPFLPVVMSYDRFGQLESWSWGDMKEDYAYDRNGRFEGVTYGDGNKIVYSFRDATSVKPYKVSVTSGVEHLLEHDEGGALSAVTTPRGHKYTFHVQPSLLHNRFTFTPPGSPRHPYQLFYSDDGRVLAEVLPHQSSRVIYHYDTNGRLHMQLFGDGSVEYGYHPETGLLRAVSVRERGFELRSDNKYHAGLVKEQRVRFGTSSGLDSAKLRFLYDGNARPRRVEVEINGKDQPDYDMKYDMILGSLDSIGDMKITSSQHNTTVVQDVRKTILRVTGYDPHGRIVESSLTLRSRMVHRNKYNYDTRGRLASMSTWRGPGSTEVRTNYSYTPDGFLQAVDGAESWHFRYDKNGNMIAVVEGGREMTATYDGADRLVGWGDVELNTYSSGGTVVRQGEVHLTYSARGNLKSAWQQGHYKVWCRHDHRGRLTVWEDDHGNVTQFFYADLLRPDLPTHIHYPKRGDTHSLEYDKHGHLMAVNTGRHKLWVSTDHLGSPVAVFDDSGVLLKEIVRSPWGATVSDSKPDLLLHVDFQGSIRDPVTGFLSFGLHTYDPVHALWMAPRYDLVTSAPDHVDTIYVHRFHNNDPVNSATRKPQYYTDLDSWLKLFGVDLSKMLGSSYHDETVEKQQGGLLTAAQLAPSLSIISGLSCSIEGVLKHFSRPSLLPESLVRSDAPAWAIPGWAALGRFSSSPPVLGPGVLVSRVEGRALVTLVPSKENPVVQDVARDVLNGSALLDVTLTHHHHHTLYLVKENAELRHDDLQQLQRLSGRFNVSAKDNGEHHEIRVVGSDVSLVLLYGVDPPSARHRLLRHAHRRAVDRAWENERLLVEHGSPSTYEWSAEERVELVSKGTVAGYVAADMHSIHRYPLLADDPTNVVFRRDSGRRRRRSHSTPHS